MIVSKKLLFQAVGLLFLFFCAVLQIRFAIHEQEVFINKNNPGSVIETSNPHLLTNYAKKKHLFEADLEAAKNLLVKALESNPYYIPAWLGLAEVENDFGQTQTSVRILDYINFLTKDIKRWRWEKTLVVYQLGLMDLLSEELRYIITEIPGKQRNDALQLAFSIWGGSEEILKNLGIENIVSLLNFTINKNLAQHALYFYSAMDENSIDIEDRDLLSFIEMLIRNGEIVPAKDIWRDKYHS